MLPHFVAQDFREVLDGLNRAGYAFEAALVRAAFRVSLSRVRSRSACRDTIEIRQATEPWYVLGEEGTRAERRAMWIPRWSGCRCGWRL